MHVSLLVDTVTSQPVLSLGGFLLGTSQAWVRKREDTPCPSPHGDRVWIQRDHAAHRPAVESGAVVGGTQLPSIVTGVNSGSPAIHLHLPPLFISLNPKLQSKTETFTRLGTFSLSGRPRCSPPSHGSSITASSEQAVNHQPASSQRAKTPPSLWNHILFIKVAGKRPRILCCYIRRKQSSRLL